MSSLATGKQTKGNRDAKYGSQAGPINVRKGDEKRGDYTSGSKRKYIGLDPKSGTKMNEGNLKLLRLAANKNNLHYVTEGGWHKSRDHPVKWINAIENVFETEVITSNGKQYKFTGQTTILIPSHVRWLYEHPPANQGKPMSFVPGRMIKIKRAPNQPPLKTMTEGKKKKAAITAKKQADSKKAPSPYNAEQKKAAIKRYLAKRKKRYAKSGTVGTGLKSLSISTPKKQAITPKVHTPPAQAFIQQQQMKEEREQSRISDRNSAWNYQNSVVLKKFKQKFKDIQAIKKESSKDSIFKHIHKIISRIDQHIHFTTIELDKSYTYSQSNFSGQWNKRGYANTKTIVGKDGNKKVARATQEDKDKQKAQIDSITQKLGTLEKMKNRLSILRDDVRPKFNSKKIDVKTEKGYTAELKKNYKDLNIDYVFKHSGIESGLDYDDDDTQQFSAMMKDIFSAVAKPCRANDINFDEDYYDDLKEIFNFEIRDLDGIDVIYGFQPSEQETIEKVANSRGLVKLRKDKSALKAFFDNYPEIINNYIVNVIAHQIKQHNRLLGMQNAKPPALPKPWSKHTSKSQQKDYLYNAVTKERLWIVDPRNPCVVFRWGGANGREKILVNVCGNSSSGGRIIAVKDFNNGKPFSMTYQKNPNLWISLIVEGYGIDQSCPWLDVFYVNSEKKSSNNKQQLYIHKPWLHWLTYHIANNQGAKKHLQLLKANKFGQIISFEQGNIFIFDEYAQPSELIHHVQTGLLIDETTSYLKEINKGVFDTNNFVSEPGPLYYYLKYENEGNKQFEKKMMNEMENASSLSLNSSSYSNVDDYMFQNFHVVKTHPQNWDVIQTKYEQAGKEYLRKDIKRLKKQINSGVWGRPKIIQKRMYQGKEITEYPSYHFDSRETDHYEGIGKLLSKMEELYSTMGSGSDSSSLKSLSDDSIENLDFSGGRRKHRTRRKKRRKKKTKRRRGGKRKTKRRRKKNKTRKR